MRPKRNRTFAFGSRFLRVYAVNVYNVCRAVKIACAPFNRVFAETEKGYIVCGKIGVQFPQFKVGRPVYLQRKFRAVW